MNNPIEYCTLRTDRRTGTTVEIMRKRTTRTYRLNTDTRTNRWDKITAYGRLLRLVHCFTFTDTITVAFQK